MKQSLILAVAWMLFVGLKATAASESLPEPVRIGVLAKRGDEQCLAQWGATATYLTEQIPEYAFSIIPLGFDEIQPAIEHRTIEFVFANPSFYINLEKRFGTRRIATLCNLHSDGTKHKIFAGTIFCRANRKDLQNLNDLKNKRFMAVDERSLGGWHMAWRELKEQGIDPYSNLDELHFGGTHDAVVYAVRDGAVDAGTVRSDTLERMASEGTIRLDEFKILHPHEHGNGYHDQEIHFLHSTRHYPEWPFAKLLHTPDDLSKKVSVALMKMSTGSPAAIHAKCAGWAIPQNYQPVHECLMELCLPPYEEHGKVILSNVLRKYWKGLLGICALFLLFLLFATRVTRLKTQLKQASLSKKEHARLMAAIEQAAETVVITDVKGTIQYVNPAFEKTSGYTRNEAIGQNTRILKSGIQGPEFYKKIWKVLERGETWSGQFINKKKNGSLYTEEATLSPVKDTSGVTINYVAVKRDITHELALEEQYHHAQKLESVGRLAGGIAHDFNNILQTITGFSELILGELENQSSCRSDVIEIQKAAKHASDLTRQLLTFSRKQPTEYKVVDLNKVFSEGKKMLQQALDESIHLTLELDSQLKPVNADISQILQIALNLVGNARDAIPNGGEITLCTQNRRITEKDLPIISNSRPGEWVCFTVSDSGTGMNKRQLNHLFEPFYTTKRVGKGTGLGLSVVYGIVKKHGGWIHVESTLGRGSVFEIFLPTYNTRTPPDDSVHKERSFNQNLLKKQILLMEDDPMVLDLTTEILRDIGYAVWPAASTSEAKEIFATQNGDFDMLFFDVMLPDGNGIELADTFLAQKAGIPILLFSGSANRDSIQGLVKEKGFNFIRKPFNLKRLLDVVDLTITHQKITTSEGKT